MTREHVKQIAITQVKQHGLINMSLKGLCEEAKISDGSFKHLMGCTFTEFIHELEQEGHTKFTRKLSKKRVLPSLRKEHILSAALGLAEKDGYLKLTQAKVAEEAGVTGGLVNRYFGTMAQLRRDVMRKAVTDKILPVIAQGLAAGDDQAKAAPQEIKSAAVALLT